MTYYVLAISNQPHRSLSWQRGDKGNLNTKFLLYQVFVNYSNNFGWQLSHTCNKVPSINSVPDKSIERNVEATFSVKHDIHDCIQIDPQFFTKGLPGGSTKSRPTGHRRCRPPHLVTAILQPAWTGRPKGHRRGRPPNTYHTFEANQSRHCQQPREIIERRCSMINVRWVPGTPILHNQRWLCMEDVSTLSNEILSVYYYHLTLMVATRSWH